MKNKIISFILFISFVISIILPGCSKNENTIDYSDSENWAFREIENTSKRADLFFICPTVYGGSENQQNMPMNDEQAKADFIGATNMEMGIYEHECRMFVPFYRQIGLNTYNMIPEEREQYLKIAYEDVKTAFDYYIDKYNDDRPIIIAGFSQGADMAIRLMKEFGAQENIMSNIVACYAIGWSLEENEVKEYPHLKPAKKEDDTGVIITFNSEAEFVESSLTVPKGIKTYAINPLNWKTDSSVADKSLNKGACFTDYSGAIVKEVPELTGAYIDSVRGALKVTDVTPDEFPSGLNIFNEGVYHLYDYQFFFKNLQENVSVRLDSFYKEQ